MTEPYYADERCSLYQADALAVLAGLPDGSVDVLMADPPYSSGGMVRGDRTGTDVKAKYSGSYGTQPDHAEFTGDNRDQRGYLFWCSLWLSECLRIVRPGGLIEGRRFIGVELSPHFAEVAERRIREAQGQAVPRGAQDALDFGGVA